MQEIREVLELDKNEAIATRHWNMMPCSAVTGEGLLEGINWVVNDVRTFRQGSS